MKRAFTRHWPEYMIEGLCLGMFMISACSSAALPEHPASPVRMIIASCFPFGYCYLPTPNEPPTNRLEPCVTIHLPSPGRFLLSDRNRAGLDWKSGNFSRHYPNRIDVERPREIYGYHSSPYVAAEFWYTSQYEKWSTTVNLCRRHFPFGNHVGFNPYYEHENNTGKRPNQQLNQLGLILNLWSQKVEAAGTNIGKRFCRAVMGVTPLKAALIDDPVTNDSFPAIAIGSEISIQRRPRVREPCS